MIYISSKSHKDSNRTLSILQIFFVTVERKRKKSKLYIDFFIIYNTRKALNIITINSFKSKQFCS